MGNPSTGAFFDFDRTLTMVETPRLGIRYLRERSLVGTTYLIKVFVSHLLYRNGILSDETMAHILISFYRNKPYGPFVAGARDFYRDVIRPHLAPAIVQRLREHQASHHVTVLVSAGLRYLLEPVVEDLGFEKLLCTDLEVDPRGTLTGRTRGPVCTDRVKRYLVARLAADSGIDLGSSYAYGNHEADIPMLELVGNPCAVEPTDALRKHALSRGWPILHYT